MLPSGLSQPAAREKGARQDGYIKPLITSHVSAMYIAADALTIMGALWLVWALAGAGARPTAASGIQLLYLGGLVGWVLFVALAMRRGLYRSWRVASMREELISVAVCWVMAVGALTLLAVLLGYDMGWRHQPLIVEWYVIGGGVLVAQRFAVRYAFRALRRAGRNYRRVAILGATDQAVHLHDKIARSAWMGLRMNGVYDDRTPATNRTANLCVRGTSQDLLTAAHAGEIDVVYIALSLNAVEPIRKKIEALMDTTASVYLVPDMFAFGLVDSRVLHVDDIPVFTVTESPFIGIEGWSKRWQDLIVGSLIMTTILMPMILIAIGIKLTSSGPVFFRQKRYGLDGKPINVWKFRSMQVAEEGAGAFRQATKNDSRVTPFGAMLRKTSLDELPQFINVLGGSMSIVGPRPHPIALNESFRKLIPGYMLRHKVKPGITGWAQINGWRGETDTLEKMERRIEYDLDYLRRWSVWFDLKIIVLTIVRGFTGSNAY